MVLNYSIQNPTNYIRENGQKGLVTSKMGTGHKYEDTDICSKTLPEGEDSLLDNGKTTKSAGKSQTR